LLSEFQTPQRVEAIPFNKLRGHRQLSPQGLASEIVAALLAQDLGLPVAPPRLSTLPSRRDLSKRSPIMLPWAG